jgi:hypothetical protein
MSYGLPSYVLMNALVAALQDFTSTRKGSVTPAHDPAEAIVLLGNAPQGWDVIVTVDDEENAEPEAGGGVTTVSETQFVVIVRAGLGLAAQPGKQIYASRAGGSPSVLELAEGVRSFVRGLALVHEDLINCVTTFRWQRSTWVSHKPSDNEPTCYGRQHIFTLMHRIENAALVDPVPITWPPA